MAVITSADEKIRRKARNEVDELYDALCRSKKYTVSDAAEWLGCSKGNVIKIFHSGGVKAWQYLVVKKYLDEEKEKNKC